MAEEKKSRLEATKDYIGELRNEMRKVTWPNRKQVEGTTAVVIVSVFLFAGYFAIVDLVMRRSVSGILTFFTK